MGPGVLYVQFLDGELSKARQTRFIFQLRGIFFPLIRPARDSPEESNASAKRKILYWPEKCSICGR
jgi:hypothetical protein